MHKVLEFALKDSLCTEDVFKLPIIKICVGIEYFKTLNKRHLYIKFKLSPFQALINFGSNLNDGVGNNYIFVYTTHFEMVYFDLCNRHLKLENRHNYNPPSRNKNS